MTATIKPACSQKKFDRDVIVMPEAVADTCLNDRGADIDRPLEDWFRMFVGWYVRWLYANDKKWKRELKADDPRDFLYTWVGHWADAFLKDPATYMAHRRLDMQGSPDPEWQPGGALSDTAPTEA